MPLDALNLKLGYSYLDAEYTEFIGTGGQDFSGNPAPASPENTVSFAANYEIDLSGDWVLLLGADWFWTDDYNLDVTDDDRSLSRRRTPLEM